jgi:hypothetical protein
MSVDLTDRPYVFLSHSRTCRPYVRRLDRHLARRGITVWYDLKVPGGADWEADLEWHVAHAAAVVVVMSAGAENSKWVTAEISTARRQRKKIFPLLLDGTRFASLNDLQDVSVAGGRMPDERWIRTVRDAIGGTAPRPRRWPAAVAGVASVVLAAAGVLLLNRPDTNAEQARQACEGRAARIGKVSTVSPGHTGHEPVLTVTVCVAAPPQHEYWLMDYTEEGTIRSFYPKVQVTGTPGSKDITVTHSAATSPGSGRHYVVVDVPSERVGAVHTWLDAADDAGVPIVRASPGAAPDGLTIVSNAMPGTL